MPGGHTGTEKPSPTAFPAFLTAISGPTAGDALAAKQRLPAGQMKPSFRHGFPQSRQSGT